MRYLSRVLYGFAIFIICVTAALLLQIDSSAMSMADALFPGSGRVVCLILLASEAAGAPCQESDRAGGRACSFR